jgi:CRP/FNR family cyclic AMP-dependent transcriptional regulator
MLSPIETIKILYKNGHPLSLKTGDIIFEQGQFGDVMYGIIEGEVGLFLGNLLVETIEKGDLFGEGALVQPAHLRATTAKALTDAKLVTLDQERFLFAVQETPLFALQALKSFSDRLRKRRAEYDFSRQV